MRAKRPHDKPQLHLHQGLFTEGHLRLAQDALMRRVFDDAGQRNETLWWTTAYFNDDGYCVASTEARVLPFVVGEQPHELTGLRRVAVDPAYRGQGLMRNLMKLTIHWCAKQSANATLLFTSSPELYAGFGFTPVPQFAFTGAPPEPLPLEPSRQLDLSDRDDRTLLENLMRQRAAVSSQVAIDGADDLVIDNLTVDDDLIIAFAESLNAIVVYEHDDGIVTLVDIIAPRIPAASAILGSLRLPVRELRTLFPPDRIGWAGDPRREDTGLMCRGPLREAMTRPFMLPPTAEF